MRFLRKNNIEKTILVISDLHLGAGAYVEGNPNFLEDFHYDEELVEFLNYFSSGEFSQRPVELIINGDFFDLLAVPFVPFFDDEYWSEEAALHKLKIIISAHFEIIEALNKFLSVKNKKIVYIFGNHDGECHLPSLQKYLKDQIDSKYQSRFQMITNDLGEYSPLPEILVKHGHDYEIANKFLPSDSIIEDNQGKKYFLPPWGSYYVVRIINKFKESRGYINSVRPIKNFLINGLIYDTLFTIRFIFANLFYFVMVRFIVFFKQGHPLKDVFFHAMSELELFRDYESMTTKFFDERPDIKLLIMGHTHGPLYKIYGGEQVFLNTGTWTDMHDLGFENNGQKGKLTFAQINVLKRKGKMNNNKQQKKENLETFLYSWRGRLDRPYEDFL